MECLRYYPTPEIEGAAEALHNRLNGGEISLLNFYSCSIDFRFRDRTGKYWLLDTLSGHWYRFEQDSWKKNDARPDLLLGLDWLSESLIQYHKTQNRLGGESFKLVEMLSLSRTEAYKRIIKAVTETFQKGLMSSVEVEDFLAWQYYVDEHGRLWAMGVNSYAWYCFDGGAWRVQDDAPHELNNSPRPSHDVITCENCSHTFKQGARCPKCGTILDREKFEKELQASARLLEFLLSRSDLIPERIVDPWLAPPGYPAELDLRCPSCQTSNLPDSRYCRACGALLVCPHCGADNRPNSRFCRMCGQRLVE